MGGGGEIFLSNILQISSLMFKTKLVTGLVRTWSQASLPGTHWRVSGLSSSPSGQAQVYLGECSLI